MSLQFLIDENLSNQYCIQLLRRSPQLVVHAIGQEGVPGYGAPDPEILRWCEDNDFVLVTEDRRSMPGHLEAHLAAGGHVPGILTLRPWASMGEVIEELLLLADVAVPDDLRDQLVFIPV
ncbi:DUF5615 family PIN-like protein [Gloeobacter kilaueensis]|uniref:DUF5615 domain-containing protein n=1 Tax=Gloeobacter kilaueensis (strain ATCC BAA-2537 / CCAP 1431/1 / ULC 316 / JS1) TaxID=1183438 RepID=U5QQZ1_GLOK1|nr:DUF5615 family PIN-like protein [Gloeobacter kilaueensis]AGY60069.1 hypothetical protein GKIL_3823 [Gloeobacter kilaueensis JS1]